MWKALGSSVSRIQDVTAVQLPGGAITHLLIDWYGLNQCSGFPPELETWPSSDATAEMGGGRTRQEGHSLVVVGVVSTSAMEALWGLV